MKKKWFFLAAIFIACVLEATVLNYFGIFGVKPNILLIAVVASSLFLGLKDAFILSILAGMLKDVFCAHGFVYNTPLFALWSLLIVTLARKMSLENNLVRAALVFIAAILHNVFLGLIFAYTGRLIAAGVFFKIILLESLYTLFISFLLLRVFKPSF